MFEQCHLSIESAGQNTATVLADCLGMESCQQKHRDEDECRRCQAEICCFRYDVRQNIARGHDEPPAKFRV
jgi:hypothetical protein